ncbi:MAG: hypothetical protein LBJ32_02300 [Oscillospiraceae bacterium]|jgi:sporulation integral membrane protein YlbJ|nr:hypothetical protein [Oscillospiraceae bacterium]
MIKIKIFQKILIAVLIISAFISMTLLPEIASSGVISGMKFCAEILIPSIFPFIIFSSWIVNSGLSAQLGKIFSKICKFLFYLPGSAAPVIMLSFLGGYPAGAKGISDLFENNLISQEQSCRMAQFAFGAGPAFIISVIGNIFLKDKFIAKQIFLSQILSSILIGIFLGIYSRNKNKEFFSNQAKSIVPEIQNALIKSCESAAQVTINMCAFVIFFSVLISFINKFNIYELLSQINFSKNFWEALITPILEVTQGCNVITKNLGAIPALFSFMVGFGGFCVHCQIFSILNKIKISYLSFLIVRIFHGLTSALITTLLTCNLKTNVSAPFEFQFVPEMSTHIFGSISIFLCCIYLLLTKLHQRSNS